MNNALRTIGYIVPEWPRDLLDLTAGDVVAMIAQQLEVMGKPVELTAETRDAAEHAAALLLGAFAVTKCVTKSGLRRGSGLSASPRPSLWRAP